MPLDLQAAACAAMAHYDFEPGIPADAEREAARIPDALPAASGARDLRGLLWSSIDNADTRDLDQLAVTEALPDGGTRLLLAIADVAAYVAPDSGMERHAAANTTTVYAGVATFPMIPERLSTDLTSLREGADRLAVVAQLDVTREGETRSATVYRAVVRNKAQLAYEPVGAWLSGQASAPPRLAGDAPLAEELRRQDALARTLRARRHRLGALELARTETRAVRGPDGAITVEEVLPNPARELIEDLMIAANSAVATFLESRGLPSIRRVVRSPARWERIVDVARRLGESLPAEPDPVALAEFLRRRRAADAAAFPELSLTVVKLLGPGEYALELPGDTERDHFSLSVDDYAHSTAPNRRYADLVTQRLLHATLAGASAPYSAEALGEIAARCTRKEGDAKKVERLVRKLVAASAVSGRVGETFDAVVTGVKRDATYVRTISPPVEGRVVRGEAGMDVGDRVRVRLAAVDETKGWIDFEGVR
ncbi:MAG: RNB domain-containing ribonuclease [Gemmatimonadaceae bacterium]